MSREGKGGSLRKEEEHAAHQADLPPALAASVRNSAVAQRRVFCYNIINYTQAGIGAKVAASKNNTAS